MFLHKVVPATFSLYTKMKKSPKKRNLPNPRLSSGRSAGGGEECHHKKSRELLLPALLKSAVFPLFFVIGTDGDNNDPDNAQEEPPPESALHAPVIRDSFRDKTTNNANNQIPNQICDFHFSAPFLLLLISANRLQ
ncbi:MAG: hypothetical protein IKG32_01585 [Clostridia bacterium]|nr:hypothetical protein [Clostridia bacterium]